MPRMMQSYGSIDEYITQQPKNVQKILKQLRKAIRSVAPRSGEAIKYGIPTITLNGNLVHFAAYTTHIGFYPGASGIRAFKKELSTYETAKGTVRFPLDKSLPLALIKKIVAYRVKEMNS